MHRRTKKKKDLHDPDNHDGVITHQSQTSQNANSSGPQEASFQTKLVEDGIPVELVQILKYDVVKMLHSIVQHIWKTQQWPQDWKMSVFFPITKKGNAKECSKYWTIALISHSSNVMLKFSKPGFNNT